MSAEPDRGRRTFLLGALGLGAAGLAASAWRRGLGGAAGTTDDPLLRAAEAGLLERLHDPDEGGRRAAVFVAKADRYELDLLLERVQAGLAELGLGRDQVAGKRVLLKPNLVETKPENPHINTHPTLVLAVAEAFRRLDAAEVKVGEGQGHRRDSWLVLEESTYLDRLAEAHLPYVDLNHDDVRGRRNLGVQMGSAHRVLHLPRTLDWADILVSMPKLKVHHWVGCTLSLKNLFGTVPGTCYGWPKNVLHQAGIESSILDLAKSIPVHLAVVDGVVGMEGDGPINGTPRAAGVVVMGRNAPAVDATCTRLMRLRTDRVAYLVGASLLGLGPIREAHIEQRGEPIQPLLSDFATPSDVDYLAALKLLG